MPVVYVSLCLAKIAAEHLEVHLYLLQESDSDGYIYRDYEPHALSIATLEYSPSLTPMERPPLFTRRSPNSNPPV